MEKNITLNYKNKKIPLKLKQVRAFGELKGLMFCRREKSKALLFSFKKPMSLAIHSFFVFPDFIALWLDENGKIIEMKKVKPWKLNIKPQRKFTKLIEIPINGKYRHIIELLDED